MGNDISNLNFRDTYETCQDALVLGTFLHQYDIATLEQLFEDIEVATATSSIKNRLKPLKDKHSSDAMLAWTTYFNILTKLKENAEKKRVRNYRAKLHTSAYGYMMERIPVDYSELEPLPPEKVPEEIPPASKKEVEDNYTEDEASVVSDSDLEENETDSEDEEEEDGEDDDEEEGDEDEDREKGKDGENDEGKDESSVKVGGNTSDEKSSSEKVKSSNKEGGAAGKDKKNSKTLKHTESKLSKSNKEDKLFEKSKKEIPREKARLINPAIYSPVFFGYSFLTQKEVESEREAARLALEAREKKSLEEARRSRESNIEKQEKFIKTQTEARQKKIAEMTSKYEASQKAQEEILAINQEDMPENSFKHYKIQWEIDYKVARMAYEEELKNMIEIDRVKTAYDTDVLVEFNKVIEALKDATAQQLPSADSLETIAKEEINRFILNLEDATANLHKTRTDYFIVRKELEDKVARIEGGSTKKIAKDKVQELRSMLNVSESRFKQAQREIEVIVAQLRDAEILLQMALRMKEREKEFLPLYDNLKKGNKSDNPKVYPPIKQIDFLVAVSAYMKGNFEEKLNFVFKILNFIDKVNLYSYDFIVSLIFQFQTSLFKIGLYPEAPDEIHVFNTVKRFFERLELNIGKDYLSDFEFKNYIVHICSGSKLLLDLFSIKVHSNINIGTFQRNNMNPIILFQLGMISQETLFYRYHQITTRYKPCLSPKNKFQIHERAILMGQDDPLKPDYSKLIAAEAKAEKNKSHTQPLTHGHIMYSNYQDFLFRTGHAITIQKVYRSFRDRKFAELSAKFQAFNEAKLQAIREMKAKIVKEFQARENSTGMGKMKWDAKVRMVQAKLKLQNLSTGGAAALVGGGGGAGTSRNDAVMVLLEEAIASVKEEIEKRFLELQKSEDFAGIDFEKLLAARDARFVSGAAEEKKLNTSSALNSNENDNGIMGMLGIPAKPKVEDAALVILDDSENRKEAKAGEDAEARTASNAALQALKNDLLVMLLEGSYIKPRPEHNINHNSNSKKLNRFKRRGEFITEKLMRLAMSNAEPDPIHLKNRLRSIHNTCTLYKVDALLQELPSKRLIIKYVQHMLKLGIVDNQVLTDELKKHFKFEKSCNKLADIFEDIVKSDVECGELYNRLVALQYQTESGIFDRLKEEQWNDIERLREQVKRRVETNELVNQEIIIKDEYSRSQQSAEKFQKGLAGMIKELMDWRDRYKKVKLACNESERRLKIARKLHYEIVDKIYVELDVEHHERINWMKRLHYALHLPEDKMNLKEQKYYEIRAICKEFLATIESDAIIILNEHKLPNYKKSIPAVAEYKCHGRQNMTGRGFEGSSVFYSYEAHNITYIVVEDYHGIFNGSDEYAMKASGKDRLGSLEYFKVHVEGLNVPLTATFDYSGFRVFCQAKLPTEIVLYNDDGEVRKISENFVYGTQKDGDNFINKVKLLNNMFRAAGSRLNLAAHEVKGLKDITWNLTYASSDIKGYKGAGPAEFYIKDFWRAFPAELPEYTPHLVRVPRDQSVFWRQLRPEFVRQYPKALSPDANSIISSDVKDFKEHMANLIAATKYLVEETIPEYAEYLASKEYFLPISEGLGMNVSEEFHIRGINLRHMGFVRSLLWRKLPGKINIFFREACLRSSRDLREELQVNDKIAVAGKFFVVTPDNEEFKFTNNIIPISEKYLDDSFNGIEAYAGRVSLIQNTGDFNTDVQATLAKNEPIATTLLCEMIARTVKNMIRLQLRQYVDRAKITSYQFKVSLIVEYMNILTGSHPNAHEILEESIFENVRLRFGNFAIRPAERSNLHHTIRPATKYLIKRLQAMFGLQLSTSCLAEFYNRPKNFAFVTQDIVSCFPVVKHNIPILSFSDAMLLSCKASAVEELDYYKVILSEKPPIFFKLNERKGCRELVNHGFLGNVATLNLYSTKSQAKETAIITGYVSPGCELESAGPIAHDPFSRAVSLKPVNKSYIESKFHPLVVPSKMSEPFSVEVWVRVTGASDTTRTMLMCGRFAILAARDNNFSFVFMNNMHEVNFRMGPIEMYKWTHLMATYDGITLRCYYNSVETICTEVEVLIQMQEIESERELEASLNELLENEESEKRGVKDKTIVEAEKYFASKEGIGAMKRACQNIMDSQDFQSLEIGKNEANEQTQLKMKKVEAMKQAKNMYVTDKYTINVKPTIEKFKALAAEVNDKRARDIDDGIFRSRRGLRLGSVVTAGTSREGKNFFHGDLSCVVVYNRFLSPDRVQLHYSAAVQDMPKDAQRFHAMASTKYEEALAYSPDDVMMLRGYANSLCEYLKIEVSDVTAEGISKGKMKIMSAIDEFTWRRVPEGIAEILQHLPKEPHHADIVVVGMKSIFMCDKNFFTKGICLTRKDLVDIPRIYSLDQMGSPADQISCAASIYREVTKDPELRLVYGQLNLSWIHQVKSDELVVALVRHAIEDKNLSFIRISDMFGFAFGRRQHINILDDDVEIMTHNIQECRGFDLSNCSKLTDNSIRMFTLVDTIQAIVLDYCPLITDKVMKLLHPLADRLQCLSFQQCQNLTDIGLAPLFSKCQNLFTVNMNGISSLTDESLINLCRSNTRIKSLHISGTQITDNGLSLMANFFNKKTLTSLDISFCRNVTDFGLISASQAALNLTYINLCGVNKLTEIGTQKLCSNCFNLTHINMEDLFLLLDRTFFFDKVGDGRMIADESMLKSLTYLNLTDCINITDETMRGLGMRCRKVSTLLLKGCDKLTNKGLEYLTKNFEDKIPFCDSLKILDVSYCGSVNVDGLKVLLPVCGILEEIRFNGIATVNDEFIEFICRRCSTLLRFIMQKCVFLSDQALCHFADYLWVEQVDLMNAHRISDHGIEILSIACNGMLNMNLTGLRHITDKSINAIIRNCKSLHTLNITGCNRISAKAIKRLKERLPNCEVTGHKE